jgi:Peptidase family M48
MKALQKFVPTTLLLFAVSLGGCNAAQNDLMIRNQSLAPTLLPVPKTASIEAPPATAAPATNGGQLLDEAVAAYPDLAPMVKENGIPDAVEVNINRVALYYRNPQRTLVYEKPSDFSDIHELMDLGVVPRSVERLGFQEPSMPPPWPVTITPQQAEILEAPKLPNPPPGMDPASFASKYREQADDLRSKISEVREGEAYDRVNKAFARLNPKTSLPGFDWRIVLVESPDDLVTFVPDGTIFLGDGLVSRLSDDELAAVIAHFMGHEAYGDGRDTWTEAGPVKKTTAVIGVTLLVVAAVAAGGINSPPPPYVGYSEQQEIDADYMAVRFLAAADIAPDKLFDAMAKLSSSACKLPQDASGLVDFNTFHHAQRNAADLGKMLDAGVIPSAHDRDSGAVTSVAHRVTL